MSDENNETKSAEAMILQNLTAFRQMAGEHDWERLLRGVEPPQGQSPKGPEEIDILQSVNALAEDLPDGRCPFTNKELADEMEREFQCGITSGLAELIECYARIHPKERKTVFQLAEIAGFIHSSPEMARIKAERERRRKTR